MADKTDTITRLKALRTKPGREEAYDAMMQRHLQQEQDRRHARIGMYAEDLELMRELAETMNLPLDLLVRYVSAMESTS